MTHWNYRVTKRRVGEAEVFEIREVYYDHDKRSWTERACNPFGESLDELSDDLLHMTAALGQDVIDLDAL